MQNVSSTQRFDTHEHIVGVVGDWCEGRATPEEVNDSMLWLLDMGLIQGYDPLRTMYQKTVQGLIIYQDVHGNTAYAANESVPHNPYSHWYALDAADLYERYVLDNNDDDGLVDEFVPRTPFYPDPFGGQHLPEQYFSVVDDIEVDEYPRTTPYLDDLPEITISVSEITEVVEWAESVFGIEVLPTQQGVIEFMEDYLDDVQPRHMVTM